LSEGSGGEGGLVAKKRRVARRKRGTVLLAMTCDDVPHVPSLAEVCIVLCLGNFPPALNLGVDFLLEGSLIGCHLPLPAVREAREVADVGLWEWRGKLEGSLFCSRSSSCCFSSRAAFISRTATA
jgi:hypothetical protein